mmetsp:Transcript_3589/g.6803  ORF Transcript_3589/g.6803 Transcript_3589/m.6803 type:complete len:137 (-) Transcript_3589:215-625(-)
MRSLMRSLSSIGVAASKPAVAAGLDLPNNPAFIRSILRCCSSFLSGDNSRLRCGAVAAPEEGGSPTGDIVPVGKTPSEPKGGESEPAERDEACWGTCEIVGLDTPKTKSSTSILGGERGAGGGGLEGGEYAMGLES